MYRKFIVLGLLAVGVRAGDLPTVAIPEMFNGPGIGNSTVVDGTLVFLPWLMEAVKDATGLDDIFSISLEEDIDGYGWRTLRFSGSFDDAFFELGCMANLKHILGDGMVVLMVRRCAPGRPAADLSFIGFYISGFIDGATGVPVWFGNEEFNLGKYGRNVVEQIKHEMVLGAIIYSARRRMREIWARQE